MILTCTRGNTRMYVCCSTSLVPQDAEITYDFVRIYWLDREFNKSKRNESAVTQSVKGRVSRCDKKGKKISVTGVAEGLKLKVKSLRLFVCKQYLKHVDGTNRVWSNDYYRDVVAGLTVQGTQNSRLFRMGQKGKVDGVLWFFWSSTLVQRIQGRWLSKWKGCN